MSAVTVGGVAGAGGAVGGSTVLATGDGPAAHVAQGVLAFTGFAVGLYLTVALSLIVVGFVLTRLGRRGPKRARSSAPPS